MKRLLLVLMFLCVGALAACKMPKQSIMPRFDSVYFFQTEDELKQKKVNFEQVSIFSRNLQSAVAKTFNGSQIATANGYIVVAVRSDGKIASWLDMEPNLHEYYEYEIAEAIKKLQPFEVSEGIVVFAIKMAVETPVHTSKEVPEPKDWKEARTKLEDPNNIEQLVLSLWPADE